MFNDILNIVSEDHTKRQDNLTPLPVGLTSQQENCLKRLRYEVEEKRPHRIDAWIKKCLTMDITPTNIAKDLISSHVALPQISLGLLTLLRLITENDSFNHLHVDVERSYNSKGMKMIHVAIRHNNMTLLKQLVFEFGCNLYVTDGNGFTPLHTAVFYRRRAIVDYLLSLDIDQSKAPRILPVITPLEMALKYEQNEIAEMLCLQSDAMDEKRKILHSTLLQHRLPLHEFTFMIQDYVYGPLSYERRLFLFGR